MTTEIVYIHNDGTYYVNKALVAQMDKANNRRYVHDLVAVFLDGLEKPQDEWSATMKAIKTITVTFSTQHNFTIATLAIKMTVAMPSPSPTALSPEVYIYNGVTKRRPDDSEDKVRAEQIALFRACADNGTYTRVAL